MPKTKPDLSTAGRVLGYDAEWVDQNPLFHGGVGVVENSDAVKVVKLSRNRPERARKARLERLTDSVMHPTVKDGTVFVFVAAELVWLAEISGTGLMINPIDQFVHNEFNYFVIELPRAEMSSYRNRLNSTAAAGVQAWLQQHVANQDLLIGIPRTLLTICKDLMVEAKVLPPKQALQLVNVAKPLLPPRKGLSVL